MLEPTLYSVRSQISDLLIFSGHDSYIEIVSKQQKQTLI